MRVVHTADWHLGKMLHDHDRREEHTLFFKFLLSILIEKKVDVLLVAGDIFDSPSPPPYALKMYYEFLADLYHQTTCIVVITSGNHDSPAHLEAPKEILKALNIHVIGLLPEKLVEALILLPNKEQPELAIAALPFLRDKDLRTGELGETQEEIRQNIQKGIQARYLEMGAFAKGLHHKNLSHIAMGHLTVLGASKSESERDTIHIGGLGVVDSDVFPDSFTYVALGHLHRPQPVGRDNIRYSGSPLPLSFSESKDCKEIRLLEFLEGKLIYNSALEIPTFRHLYQVKAKEENFKEILENFQPENGLLTTWVELFIEAQDDFPDCRDSCTKLSAEKNFKIIKTVIESTSDAGGLQEGIIKQNIDLLGHPEQVFLKRLDHAGIQDENSRESLMTTFSKLYGLVLDDQKPSFSLRSSNK